MRAVKLAREEGLVRVDLSKEVLFTLAQATSLLPLRRLGKKCSVSCLHRWAMRGLRGHRLRIVQVGGVRCTSREELARFFAALSQSVPRSAAEITPPTCDVHADAVERELDKYGL